MGNSASTQAERLGKKGERVAIVAGLRTPFAKQWTAYRDISALELAKLVVAEMLTRVELDPHEIEQVVYGQVVPSVHAPNIAREVVLGTGMPHDIEAYSVSRACATSYQSAVNIVEAIATTIFIGLACDYCVHVLQVHRSGTGELHATLAHVGPSLVSAAPIEWVQCCSTFIPRYCYYC